MMKAPISYFFLLVKFTAFAAEVQDTKISSLRGSSPILASDNYVYAKDESNTEVGLIDHETLSKTTDLQELVRVEATCGPVGQYCLRHSTCCSGSCRKLASLPVGYCD